MINLNPTDADSPGHSDAPPQKTTKNQNANAAGGNSATPTKCKRPMNAFMLFAKKFRVEYTQMYPGKDNRWVSKWHQTKINAREDLTGLALYKRSRQLAALNS